VAARYVSEDTMAKLLKVLIPSLFGVAAGLGASTIAFGVFANKSAAPSPVRHYTPPEQFHAGLLSAFATETPSEWSAPAADSLRHWFDGLVKAGLKAQLTHVECRRVTCVADVRWKDRDAARESYTQLLPPPNVSSLYGCTSEIYLPQKLASPYDAELIVTGCANTTSTGLPGLRTPVR
jgi:hypothetical protein